MKIYILHGWSYSLEKWKPLVSELKKKKYTPILLKIPGLTEKIDKPWTIDEYVSWLDNKLGREREIILLGHSNGGRIAINFAIKKPKAVSKLVLIDSAGVYHDDLYTKGKRKVFGFIAKTGRKFFSSEFTKNLLYKIVGERDYKEASEDMKKTMVNLITSDKILSPEKISIPTIIIWGEKDGITPLSDGRKLKKLIVNSKLLIVGNARHAPQFTHPEKVAEIISQNL